MIGYDDVVSPEPQAGKASSTRREIYTVDRRRPGRPQYVDESLIPLVRSDPLSDSQESELEHSGTPMRGVLLGLVLSIIAWILIALSGPYLLRSLGL
jgi:hypothetical protein